MKQITYTHALARRIQNYGEQDPRIHNAEMKRWRYAWARLAYLRQEIEAERISTSEIIELQSLVRFIDPADTLLLEWAGVPETPHVHEYMPQLSSEDYDNPQYVCDCGAVRATVHEDGKIDCAYCGKATKPNKIGRNDYGKMVCDDCD